MGLFGGSSSKSSKEQTTQSTNQGFSEIGGSAEAISISTTGKKARVYNTTTDFGSVQEAFSFAGKALDTVDATRKDTTAAITGQNKQFMETLAAYATTQNRNNDERMVELTKWGLGAVSLIAVATALRGRKK